MYCLAYSDQGGVVHDPVVALHTVAKTRAPARSGGNAQASAARRQMKQRGRRAEEHAGSEPRRAGHLEEREHRGMAREVLGGESGNDQHVRCLEELRQRRRGVAEMASRERLRLEEVDELVFRARPRAPLAAGECHHAQRRPEDDEERCGQRVEAIGPRRATYTALHSSTSPFLAWFATRLVQSNACASPRNWSLRRSMGGSPWK